MELNPSDLIVNSFRVKANGRLSQGHRGAHILHKPSCLFEESSSERSYQANLDKCYKALIERLSDSIENLVYVQEPTKYKIDQSIVDLKKFNGMTISYFDSQDSIVLTSDNGQEIEMSLEQFDAVSLALKLLIEKSKAF